MTDIDKAAREYGTPLSREILTELGFTQLPHYTVTGSMMKDIGRNRYLTIGCVGTPNEMLFLQEVADETVIDQVVLWNYDYDGMLTLRHLKDLLWFFTKDEKYSRQSEIDELTRELEGSHGMEEIARQTLLRKRSKIDELIEALEEFHKTWAAVADVFPSLNNQSCYIKATQLLEKYGKK